MGVKIEGSIVAIVTPFKDGKVDEEAFKELIEWQVESGTDGIVPCGTTGESATLTVEEHEQVIELCVKTVNKRVPVIAGTGANSTAEAIHLTKAAEKAGADASLQVSPYYNKPTQDGLYEHFKHVAESTSLPIVLYNIQGRTAVNILPETMVRLSKIDNIVGVKEASGSISQMAQIIHSCPDDFNVLSGDDPMTPALLAIGGRGVISVSANVAPRENARLWDAWREGKYEEAKSIYYKLFPLNRALFLETNPIPVKAALHMMGKIGPEIRLPMTPLSEPNREKLRNTMKEFGLLS